MPLNILSADDSSASSANENYDSGQESIDLTPQPTATNKMDPKVRFDLSDMGTSSSSTTETGSSNE